MKKEEIHLWDIRRILFGQATPEFLLEVLIRSLIIYILAMVVMRWLGKRMNGQLTIIELAVVVMMGAVLAVPMQLPDRGLVQGFVVLASILLLYRGFNLIALKNKRFEELLHGEMSILVKDGVLQLKDIEKVKVSKPQLYAELRKRKIFNLGKVKRMYLEACGTYSIYTEDKERPGLLLLPKEDETILAEQRTEVNALVCANCGLLLQSNTDGETCKHCGKQEWSKPVIQQMNYES